MRSRSTPHNLREEAAAALLEIIRRDRGFNDDAARKQLLQFFEAWGVADPAAIAARKRLSTVLSPDRRRVLRRRRAKLVLRTSRERECPPGTLN